MGYNKAVRTRSGRTNMGCRTSGMGLPLSDLRPTDGIYALKTRINSAKARISSVKAFTSFINFSTFPPPFTKAQEALLAVPPSVQARRLAAKYFSRIILILEVLGYNKTAWDKDLIPRMGLKLRPARSSGIKTWVAYIRVSSLRRSYTPDADEVT